MKLERLAALTALGALLSLQGCRTNDVVLIEIPAGAGGMSGGSAGGGGTAGSAGLAGMAGMAGTFGGTAGNAGTGAVGGAPEAGSGGTTGLGGRAPGSGGAAACKRDSDCEAPSRCARYGCGSEFGTCEQAQVLPCPALPIPVCGCNPRVTYWNVCIARQNGEFATDPGECREKGLACESADNCGVPGAYCARLHLRDQPGDPCSPRGGACWVIPLTCEAQMDPSQWGECPPPSPGVLPVCVDTCTAIQSEIPWVLLPPRVMCQ